VTESHTCAKYINTLVSMISISGGSDEKS
jgi:hypothetical protein